MGIFDRSSTRKSDTSSNAALQTGENSTGVNLSGIGGSGKYAQTNVDIRLTDYGAVDRAFEAVDSSFEFAAGAVSRALESSDAARVDSLMFGAGAMQAAFDESERARQAAYQESERARADAARARQLAAQQVASAQAALQTNTAQSISAVRAAGQEALSFGAGAFSAALDQVDASHERSVGSVIDFSNDAIEYVANSTRSEASESFDKLVKAAGWAVAAIAAVTLIPKLV
jgi:hypothetical protein